MLVFLFSYATAETMIIELTYKQYQFKVEKISLLNFPPAGKLKETTDYRYIVRSILGDEIQKGSISIPNQIIISPDVIYPNEKTIQIDFEYQPILKNLILLNNDNEILLDIDLMSYNRCDLDNICDNNENNFLCPQDCYNSLKDGVCHNIEDGTCKDDPDCKGNDPDCIIQGYINLRNDTTEKITNSNKEYQTIPTYEKTMKEGIIIPFLIIIIVVLVLIMVCIISKHKK